MMQGAAQKRVTVKLQNAVHLLVDESQHTLIIKKQNPAVDVLQHILKCGIHRTRLKRSCR